MRKRRIIAFVLAALFMLTLLASCGGSGDSGKASSTPTSTAKAEDKPAATDAAPEETPADEPETAAKFDDVRLHYIHCWNGGVKNPDSIWDNEVAVAIREKIGVSIEFEGIMMNETEKLNLIFASGDMPDVIGAPFWGGTGGETGVIKKAGEEGMLLPLDDHINNYPNIKDAWSVGVVSQAFLENDLETAQFGGKHYVLPVQTPGSAANIINWTYGLFARGDIVKALGIDPASITTTDALYDFLVKVRDGGFKDVNGNDIIPFSTFHDGWDYGGLLVNFNKQYFTGLRQGEDGKFTLNQFTQPYMDSVLFMRKLVAENIMDKEAFRCTDAQAEEKFGNGTAAVGSAQYGPFITATKKTGLYVDNPEMRYVPLGPLHYADGTPSYQAEYFGRGGTPCIIFPTTCSNIEAALTWIDYVNSKEGILLTKFGFEGDTYNMVDGSPMYNDNIRQRKKDADPTVNDELKNRGIDHYTDFVLLADKRKDWWKDDPDVLVPEQEEYKLMKPVKQIKGYPLTAKQSEFPELDDYRNVFAGDIERNARERAFFAATEAEAIAIIEEFRDTIRKAEGGVLERYLAFFDELYPTRDDFIF